MNILSARRTFAAAASVSVLLITAACGAQEADTSTPPASTQSGSGSDSDTAAGESDGYRAGEYTAEGGYLTPGGNQSVSVDLTLDADGTITDVAVTPEASGGNSLLFQKKFAGGIADEIVGRSIDEIEVSKVAGSSLTSGGFNAALDEIKAQAAA